MSDMDGEMRSKGGECGRCRPYPEVEIDAQSLSDVRCLTELYGGVDSETTAIMQYIFQSYILREADPELAKLLERISITEMKHHELLGTTITRLGGTPVIGGNRQFWNGAMVNYSGDVFAILNANIRGEQMAIELYKRAVRCVDNYSVKELLECIIRDEEEHLLLFQQAKSQRMMKK